MAAGQLESKIAIVTGGASGIGHAAARALAAEGARVCVADRNLEGAESVAKEIVEAGGDAFACGVDVTDVTQNDAMVKQTVERYGALHVALLNAGIALGSSILGGDVAVFDEVISVNLRGVFLGMRATAPAMIEAGGGVILATASVAGLRGGTLMPSYYASKHGVVGLVKAAAAEFAPHGIRVNAVCPGIIDTPILGPAHGVKEVRKQLGRIHLLQRVGEVGEVADLMTFLASDRASFITGAAFPVDGGATASIGIVGSGDDGPEADALRRALMDGLGGGSQA